MTVTENLKNVKNELSIVCGERPVKLIAVSKFHPVEKIEEAYAGGQREFGENRVQEAFEKFSLLKENHPDIVLHVIGHLQTNKVSKAVSVADWIQSVDSIKLIKEIEKQCTKLDKVINILIEFHTGEESKTGFLSKEEVFEALRFIESSCSHIIPCGFMTMAPVSDNDEIISKSFISLRQLQEEAQTLFPKMKLTELSMGMSGDFKIAVRECSTMVRIGTAIFGEREY